MPADVNAVKTARVRFDAPFEQESNGDNATDVQKVYLTLANPKAARQLLGKKPELEPHPIKKQRTNQVRANNVG
jgi:hypothetical protein